MRFGHLLGFLVFNSKNKMFFHWSHKTTEHLTKVNMACGCSVLLVSYCWLLRTDTSWPFPQRIWWLGILILILLMCLFLWRRWFWKGFNLLFKNTFDRRCCSRIYESFLLISILYQNLKGFHELSLFESFNQ